MSVHRDPRSLAESNRLPVLATSINEHLKAAKGAMWRGVEHAIAAGLLLIEAKELVGHGEWLPWLQANCEIGPRQAQVYMKLARNRHKVEALKKTHSDSFLTIAAAEALVGRPRAERPRGLPGQLDLLGGEEVPIADPASVVRNDCVSELIVDLEQALDVLKYAHWHTQTTNKKSVRLTEPARWRGRFAATASTIAAAITYLKGQRRGAAR